MKNKIAVLVFLITIITLGSVHSALALDFDAESTYHSVFAIYTDTGFGSGFAVGENIIATNAHVVSHCKDVFIRTYDDKDYPAKVYAIDTMRDLALLVVDDEEFVALPIGNFDDCKVGDDVVAIGTPENLELGWTLTKGVISNKSRSIEGNPFIQIDAAVNSGNSGGPLLDSKGYVIGIITRKLDKSDGIGFAIPITTLTKFINDLEITLENKVVYEEEKMVAQTMVDQSDNDELKNLKKEKSLPIVFVIIIIICVVVTVSAIILIQRREQDFDIEIKDE